MPQASDELRALMNNRFGDPVSDEGPSKYLTDAGYKISRGGMIEPKDGVNTLKEMTRNEFDCLLFLVHEWDYGTAMS